MTKEDKEFHLDAMKEVTKENDTFNNAMYSMQIKSLDDLENLAKDENTTLIETNNVEEFFNTLQSPVNAELTKE
jgi:hypothetical protein